MLSNVNLNNSHVRFAAQNTNKSPNFEQKSDYQFKKFWTIEDTTFMQQALILANHGATTNEVPVGAILVNHGKVLGSGYNRPIANCDPTAHAEVIALRSACASISNYRLPENTTLYVTLEPCTMCIGALIHARLSRLIYATTEPRAGMVESQLQLLNEHFYNHRIKAYGGLLQAESRHIIKSFFKTRRLKK